MQNEHVFREYQQRSVRCPHTINSLLSPSGGLFISSPFEGGLIDTRGLFERGGLFHLETTVVSLLHKVLEYKVEKLKYKMF